VDRKRAKIIIENKNGKPQTLNVKLPIKIPGKTSESYRLKTISGKIFMKAIFFFHPIFFGKLFKA
jgi:hypothetical protein